MDKRKILYTHIFNNMALKFKELGENLLKNEKAIKNLKKDFFISFENKNIEKYNTGIFNKIENNLDELKISMQISALNGKIKSLDMKEFSDIISVIGTSLLEEASKISTRFNQLKIIFDKIIKNFKELEEDLYSIKRVEYSFSGKIFLINDFITQEILPLLEDRSNLTSNLLETLILEIEERIDNIDYFKNSKFQTNFRELKKKLGMNLNKIKLLLQDFNNFVFKISYLTLITKIEVGKLKDDRFIMVINNLEKITEETANINSIVVEIYKYYQKLFKEIDKDFSKISLKLRELIFRKYNGNIADVREELEGFLQFLKNEVLKIQGEIDVN